MCSWRKVLLGLKLPYLEQPSTPLPPAGTRICSKEFFPFKVDPISEGTWYARMQRGSNKSCLPHKIQPSEDLRPLGISRLKYGGWQHFSSNPSTHKMNL